MARLSNTGEDHNTFGGYASGSSKNSSVTCRNGDSTSSGGWKVLAINGNQVSIVHAGIPECYFYSSYQSNSNIAATLNERASVYKNNFAASARMLNESDVTNLAQDSALRKINAYYYLATPSTESKGMKFITTSGRLTQGGENAQGVRPVIILREDVRTTGQSNGAWVLTFEATKNNSDMQLTTTGKIGDLFNFVKDTVDNS